MLIVNWSLSFEFSFQLWRFPLSWGALVLESILDLIYLLGDWCIFRSRIRGFTNFRIPWHDGYFQLYISRLSSLAFYVCNILTSFIFSLLLKVCTLFTVTNLLMPFVSHLQNGNFKEAFANFWSWRIGWTKENCC